MDSRQRDWPRAWLMTDERMGDALWPAIDRLPEGEAGIVVRHQALEPSMRSALAARIATICRSRGLVLAIAGDGALARDVGADLVHNPGEAGSLPHSRYDQSPK